MSIGQNLYKLVQYYDMAFKQETYIKLQRDKILQRLSKFKKLYLEFGGKLFDDYHMSRCVPGFQPDVKIKMLLTMREKCEIIISINAEDIERGKVRPDSGLTYENEALRLVQNFASVGLKVNSIVIIKYNHQPAAKIYAAKLERMGLKVHLFQAIPGYPTDVNLVVSDRGYGANPFIQTTKPIVVVTGPGAGSGKLSVALSQLYHELKNGKKAGFAKFETLPVWNFRLKHPLNMAYEAATVNINDINMIDIYHFEKYGEAAVNYNRDIEAFPLLRNILNRMYKKPIYHSPTDMGVNMVGFCIEDEAAVERACRQEIIRRYFQTLCDFKLGIVSEDAVNRIKMICEEMDIKLSERPVVDAALEVQYQTGKPSAAIQLKDGRVIAASENGYTSAGSELVLKALQTIMDTDDKIIPDNVMQKTKELKDNLFSDGKFLISIGELLLILSSSSIDCELCSRALAALPKLQGAEIHTTNMLREEEQRVLRRLKINLTQEPIY